MRADLWIELVKALVWPVIVAFFLITKWQSIENLIQKNGADIGGIIKINGSLADAKETVDNVQENWREILARQQEGKAINSSAIEDAIKNTLKDLHLVNQRLDVAQSGLDQANINGAGSADVPAPTGDATGKVSSSLLDAIQNEHNGFQAIANKDFEAALSNFDASYKAYPTLHNVDEIRRMLREKATPLKKDNDTAWRDLDAALLAKYSWGMPSEVRSELQSRKDGARQQ